jgi:hypothetical protein
MVVSPRLLYLLFCRIAVQATKLKGSAVTRPRLERAVTVACLDKDALNLDAGASGQRRYLPDRALTRFRDHCTVLVTGASESGGPGPRAGIV